MQEKQKPKKAGKSMESSAYKMLGFGPMSLV